MSINKAILVGNVGKDPQVRDVNGSKVANFTLATSEKGNTKQDGTQVSERTEWHNIVVFGKLAEVVEKFVHQGSKLYVEGKIRTKSYDSKKYFSQEGAACKQYVTAVFADVIEMLDKAQQSQLPAAPAAPAAPGYPPQGYPTPQYPQQQDYYPPQGYPQQPMQQGAPQMGQAPDPYQAMYQGSQTMPGPSPVEQGMAQDLPF